jgi:chemotaxis-related protein WspB
MLLLLLFRVGDQQYALETNRIVEVLPLVNLKPAPTALGAKFGNPLRAVMTGLFNYRGQPVPVLDLCQVLGGQSCRLHLSSRMILVQSEAMGLIGLLAERVVETLRIAETDQIAVPHATLPYLKAPYLNRVIVQAEMIHCLDIERLWVEIRLATQIAAVEPKLSPFPT